MIKFRQVRSANKISRNSSRLFEKRFVPAVPVCLIYRSLGILQNLPLSLVSLLLVTSEWRTLFIRPSGLFKKSLPRRIARGQACGG
jgi:hypothetical protein